MASSAASLLRDTASARARSPSSSSGSINEYKTECNRILFSYSTHTINGTINNNGTATPPTTGAIQCPHHRVPLPANALQATHKVGKRRNSASYRSNPNSYI
jgi:hypothetical protein